MPRVTYIRKKFSAEHSEMIGLANTILADYAAQGYDLTLRQLYYQFVARDLIENTDRSYKRLGSIVNDARMAGKIDWDSIIDRTRNLRELASWDSPASVMRSAAAGFRNPKWDDQPYYVEVWVEKDALVGVIARTANDLQVPYFSCRGYTSQSEMWSASQRIRLAIEDGKKVKILHLGDHDPSGVDMTRDIRDRIDTFIATDFAQAAPRDGTGDDWDDICKAANIRARDFFEVDRIALNMDQVEQYDPPPNPAKLTDARARGYIYEYGDESWELDALEPSVLDALIREGVEDVLDWPRWESAVAREEKQVSLLTAASNRWNEVVEMLEA